MPMGTEGVMTSRCHDSRRGVMLMLPVLAALWRLFLWFLRVVRRTELYDWEGMAHWNEEQKISHYFGWKRSPRLSEALGCLDTTWAHTDRFPFLLKLPLQLLFLLTWQLRCYILFLSTFNFAIIKWGGIVILTGCFLNFLKTASGLLCQKEKARDKSSRLQEDRYQ